MTLLIALFVGLTAMLVTLSVAEVVSARPRVLSQRLKELERNKTSRPKLGERKKWIRLSELLLWVGQKATGSEKEREDLRERLSNAGFRSPNAVSIYWSLRMIMSVVMSALTVTVLTLTGAAIFMTMLMTVWLAVLGWLGPSFYLGRMAKARETEIQSALADTLDLLVVCVDAGLGLNQAWLRVADEIRSVSKAMSDELSLVNLQIRAGVPREEALRNLAKRSQSPDMRSLAGVLIQTDRFGTSVSQALRVQADSLRTKRRHRAEEAAAKTAVKLSFPLVFLILPALFVVLMGGAVIEVMRAFAHLQ